MMSRRTMEQWRKVLRERSELRRNDKQYKDDFEYWYGLQNAPIDDEPDERYLDE